MQDDEFEFRLNVKDDIPGAALPDNTAVVVLNINLTPELVKEGLANDALRFIQDTRKTIGLDVSDRINLTIAGNPTIIDAVRAHKPRIMADALVTKITDTPVTYHLSHITNIENMSFSVEITKA